MTVMRGKWLSGPQSLSDKNHHAGNGNYAIFTGINQPSTLLIFSFNTLNLTRHVTARANKTWQVIVKPITTGIIAEFKITLNAICYTHEQAWANLVSNAIYHYFVKDVNIISSEAKRICME